jgi:hypothetical protein
MTSPLPSLRRLAPAAIVAATLAASVPALAPPPAEAGVRQPHAAGPPNRVALVDRPNSDAFRRLP